MLQSKRTRLFRFLVLAAAMSALVGTYLELQQDRLATEHVSSEASIGLERYFDSIRQFAE